MKDKTRNVIENLILRYPNLKCCESEIFQALDILIECFNSGGKLLVCGNGGSAADTEHIVGELMKSFKLKRKLPDFYKEKLDDYIYENLEGALPCISLVSQSALMTAYSNDKTADLVYAQQVYGYAAENDVLLGISTSGNSNNIIHAVKVARAKNVKTIGLTKLGENKLRDLCDVTIGVDENETYLIQEMHLPIYHAICAALEEEFF